MVCLKDLELEFVRFEHIDKAIIEYNIIEE